MIGQSQGQGNPLLTPKNRILQSTFLALVTPKETEVIIQSLNAKEVLGPYSIPVFLLKILSRHIALPLSITVSQSFETGVFPNKLKIGKVNPIHKKDSNDNSNYRPISIVFVFFPQNF